MRNRWMITAAAAALIAGTGFAYAQGMGGGREGGAAGAGMHQSAPSSPGATGHEHEGSAGMKSSQSEERGGAANRSAQQETKGAQKGTVGQSSAQENSVQDKSAQETKSDRAKGMSSENEENGAAGKKAEGNERNGNMKAEGRNNSSTTAAEGNRNQTTGQAGAGAKLSSEQRTRITTIIRDQHVAPVNNVNFAISVGTRVPREIGFHPLPADIVTIYPEWRGYEFFLVRDEIVVVDPRTLEIVDVLPA